VAECWDEERFASEQEGLVVFDGGSYSLGPGVIGAHALACCSTLHNNTSLLSAGHADSLPVEFPNAKTSVDLCRLS
jgi:hypothetical protein